MHEEFKDKIIEIVHASVHFQENKALDDINLTLYKGEHICLCGKNGAGKSTLLRLIRGEQWLSNSTNSENNKDIKAGIYWYNEDGTADSSALSGRSMVALVAPKQQENILSQAYKITGEELIYGGLTDSIYILAKPEGEDKKKIDNLAQSLNCTNLLAKNVAELSQGQLRILLVMRALICEPKILLLDEVMDGLDEIARNALTAVLATISHKISIVFSTHRKELLPPFVQREIYMQNGRIICDSRTSECLDTENEAQSEKNRDFFKDKYNEEVGAEIAINNANVYIDSHLILKNIHWTIKKGEQWAIYGENGSGKSTLMRLIAGDEYPALGGSIKRILGGNEVHNLAHIKAKVRLVSDLQQATYAYDLNAEEFVLSGMDNSIGLYKEITSLDKELAQEALSLLNVEHLAQRSIKKVSTGEMRRLMLARAFIGIPSLLLLDEPFSGLDPEARKNIDYIIEELCAKNVQIIYVSHYKSEIPKFITNYIELAQGQIIKEERGVFI